MHTENHILYKITTILSCNLHWIPSRNPGNTSTSKGLAIHLKFFPKIYVSDLSKWKCVVLANSSEKKLS